MTKVPARTRPALAVLALIGAVSAGGALAQPLAPAGGQSFAQAERTRLTDVRLVVSIDDICGGPTECFSLRPGGGETEDIVTTCNDTEGAGGCAAFATNCIYGGSSYDGDSNGGTCTTRN